MLHEFDRSTATLGDPRARPRELARSTASPLLQNDLTMKTRLSTIHCLYRRDDRFLETGSSRPVPQTGSSNRPVPQDRFLETRFPRPVPLDWFLRPVPPDRFPRPVPPTDRFLETGSPRQDFQDRFL